MSDHPGGEKPRDNPRYKPGNTRPDGGYVVGKNRPPKHGQFAKNDGRRRGRRRKGTKNLATDLAEELRQLVPLTEGGKRSKATKQRAIVKRLLDSAGRGQLPAIQYAFNLAIRFAEQKLRHDDGLGTDDRELIEAHLHRLFEEAFGTMDLGDPPPAGDESTQSSDQDNDESRSPDDDG
jgi:hypothetical protein